ncbi:MAG: serine/threonine-protein kinase [Deltaproteobacteria bacterium]|nr:serine/threonine-protein kinase [Deltaproteobacteria bacterium]
MSSTTDPDPLVGRLVAGRYEVLKKLNQGGVGAVYLAMQRPLDRPVALKVLLKKHADDETAIKRFEKEAAAVARLAHAHIVTLYDFGSTDTGDLYIAMEFLRGQSLRDLLDAAGFVPWERSLHIVQGICRALVAAHTQKIVHRDLKPENVMLVESNGDLDFAKVLDFGLARSIQSHVPAITRHDVIPGTPVYMSPERANGISNDPRSDLYALGAVWFELLTGEPPFPGEISIKVILRHIHEAPRRPSAAQPQNPIPPFIDDLVLELLEKAVENRPATARDLLDRLDVLSRPAGWHVGRTHDVGRRGHHDTDLQGFAVAAGELGDSDDFNFSIEEGEPLPLVKKKPPAPTLTQDDPVLLTTRKKVTATSPAPHQTERPLDSIPASSTLAPPRRDPMMAPPAGPPPSRQPTEEFLRPVMDDRPPLLSPPRAPPRIESLAQVAGWLSTAKTARTVGELCCAFLVTRFDRALVMDVRGSVPLPLSTSTASGQVLAMPPIVNALPDCRGILELAGRREAYYGPAMLNADWMPWFGALGGSAPGAMFVGGLQREGKAAFLFYADHRDITLRPMVKDTVVLLREAAGALSLIG